MTARELHSCQLISIHGLPCLPAGAYLAFGHPGRGWGVEGLLGGLIVGPFIQVRAVTVASWSCLHL
jgi:hypothetical protein